ncbi:MAG: hypothetical protein HQL69_15170 [Magnetococcales bacterium]|nr:hypothetical protein [Magnetococcales bacterium]
MSWLTFAASLTALEMIAAGLTGWLRQSCPWIITDRDLNPPIDPEGLNKFLAGGWDPELGWVRKPGHAGEETGVDGQTTKFSIDHRGARLNPGFEERPPEILVYGDSYAFARQVNNDETWSHILSKNLDRHVANFGVGNYGLDQALMRLEREYHRHPAPLVIMAVVPETLGRVLSVWKHFSEYGNTFAFKPRFELYNDSLNLIPNPVDKPEIFFHIADLLPELQKKDLFFEMKFKKDLLRFPYLQHIIQSRKRNPAILWAALRDRIRGVSGMDGHAFPLVMARNISMTAALYQEQKPVELLAAITRRFATFVRGHGSEPLLLMMPQLMDLERIESGDHYYQPFLVELRKELPCIDAATPLLAEEKNRGKLYINDKYGGHLSPLGNRIVAVHTAQRILELQQTAATRAVCL